MKLSLHVGIGILNYYLIIEIELYKLFLYLQIEWFYMQMYSRLAFKYCIFVLHFKTVFTPHPHFVFYNKPYKNSGLLEVLNSNLTVWLLMVFNNSPEFIYVDLVTTCIYDQQLQKLGIVCPTSAFRYESNDDIKNLQ